MKDELGNEFSTSDVVCHINKDLATVVWWYTVKGVNSDSVFAISATPDEAYDAVEKFEQYDKQHNLYKKNAYEIVVYKGTPYGTRKMEEL